MATISPTNGANQLFWNKLDMALKPETNAIAPPSPIIKKMGKVIIIESKSIHEYLRQLEELGENREDYKGLYGYSLGQTEQRNPLYEYPDYAVQITDEMSNLQI